MEGVERLEHIVARGAPLHPRLFGGGRLFALLGQRTFGGWRRAIYPLVQGALDVEGRGEDQGRFTAEEGLDDQLADTQEEQSLKQEPHLGAYS